MGALHADCSSTSGSEDIDLLHHSIGQGQYKPTASGIAGVSKLTVEGDCCVEEGDIGFLDTAGGCNGRKTVRSKK